MNDLCTRLVYLPEQWGETWRQSTCSDGGRCYTVRSIDTANLSSGSESKTGLCPMHQSGETSELSTEESSNLIESWLNSILPLSQQASLASPGVSPESKKVRQTSETSGQIPLESFAKYDLDTASWKMCLTFFQEVMVTSEPYSATFPQAAIMLDGVCYRQPTLVLHISERGSGYWPTPKAADSGLGGGGWQMGKNGRAWGLSGAVRLWPTPRAEERSQYNSQDEGMALSRAVKMWPTPAANPPGWKNIEVVDRKGNPPEHANQRFYNKKTGKVVQKGLEQVAKMWPTPRAGMPGSRRAGTGGKILAEEAKKWPTPTSKDYKDTGDVVAKGNVGVNSLLGRAVEPTKTKGSLDPGFVEYLMGFPIGWLNSGPLETRRFLLWLQEHGIY